MKILCLLCLLLFIIVIRMLFSKEGFENPQDCTKLSDCKTCADTYGCSWCPSKTSCVYTKKIKSTDDCNQSNTITASEQCKIQPKLPPIANSTYDGSIKDISIYDAPLYTNDVNSYLPPMVYTSDKKNCSNEDIVSSIDNMRKEIKNLKMELPGIISSSMGDSLQPMIKGILSENYYIQGFQ